MVAHEEAIARGIDQHPSYDEREGE